MKRVRQMLSQAIGREEVLRTARAQSVLREWSAIVGSALASRSRPERYERGTVWVAVEGSAWAQELRMIKDVILGRLEAKAGESGLFLDVRFGVRPLQPEEKPAEEPTHAVVEDDRGEMSIKEIAERRLRRWSERNAP